MEKTIEITGMACEGCAAKVRKALEAMPGVKGVRVDVKEKKAVVEVADTVADEALIGTVNAIGKYRAVGVK